MGIVQPDEYVELKDYIHYKNSIGVILDVQMSINIKNK